MVNMGLQKALTSVRHVTIVIQKVKDGHTEKETPLNRYRKCDKWIEVIGILSKPVRNYMSKNREVVFSAYGT